MALMVMHASMMESMEEFIFDKVPDAGGEVNALLFSADKGPNEGGDWYVNPPSGNAALFSA